MNVNSQLNDQIVFPITGYKRSIKDVPRITSEIIRKYYESRNTTIKHYRKSYSYLVEGYIDSDKILTNSNSLKENGLVFVKGKCYRSQRKNEKAYLVAAGFQTNGSEITIAGCYCECKAGNCGSCNHLMSLLRLLVILKERDISDRPQQVSCTDLPQKWNRPRTSTITPLALLDVNFQSPREGGSTKPLPCRIYDSRAKPRTAEEVEAALLKLKAAFQQTNSDEEDDMFSCIPLPNTSKWVETKMGKASKNSPMSYQLPLSSSVGCEVIHTLQRYPAVKVSARNVDFQIPAFSTDSSILKITGLYLPLPFEENDVFLKNVITTEDAKDIEKDTKSQSESTLWKKMRSTRLNSSTFGTVCKRRKEEWNKAGLKNVVDPKNIGHLNAIKYGKKFEAVARNKYMEEMHNLGHDVTVSPAGYIINPNKYWLGTSPDGFVYDPKEANPFGTIEIKCPSSLRDEKASVLVDSDDYHIQLKNGNLEFDKNNSHYHQIMGQMALSSYTWCDYVVYLSQGLIIKRVYFNENEWRVMEERLDRFFFNYMLTKLVENKLDLNH